MARISYNDGRYLTPGCIWRATGGAANLHWADYDANGTLVARGADWTCSPTDDELATWQRDIAAVVALWRGREADLARLTGGDIYIRLGSFTQGRASRNHATGVAERGLSCYRAAFDPTTGHVEIDLDGALLGAAVMGAFGQYDRALLVAGKRCGTGSDGEPLLNPATVEVVGTLARHGDTVGIYEVVQP